MLSAGNAEPLEVHQNYSIPKAFVEQKYRQGKCVLLIAPGNQIVVSLCEDDVLFILLQRLLGGCYYIGVGRSARFGGHIGLDGACGGVLSVLIWGSRGRSPRKLSVFQQNINLSHAIWAPFCRNSAIYVNLTKLLRGHKHTCAPHVKLLGGHVPLCPHPSYAYVIISYKTYILRWKPI